jgi:glucokinase
MVGLDLGGTTFNAACVSNAGRILSSHGYDTQAHDAPDILIARMADAVLGVLREMPQAEREAVKSIGVGVPGPVRSREGICVYAPNLTGWKNLPVAEMLGEKIGLPIALINDADAATLGEARFGAGRGADFLLMLTLGTGVGSGLILDGKLHAGHSQRGAEAGHMTVDFDSKRGSAGNIGTLESVCGRDAIVWRALRYLSSGRVSIIPEICPDFSELAPQHIAQAAQRGDEIAQTVWNETAAYLAAGIMNVALMTDVSRVVIGGGIAQAGEVLFAPLRRAVAVRASEMFFDENQIVPAQLGPDAGVIGAAQWAREFGVA